VIKESQIAISIHREVPKVFVRQGTSAHNMFVVARKSDKYFRASSQMKDLDINPEDSHGVCLKLIEVIDHFEKQLAEYNRIYYVFEGILQLTVNDKEVLLNKGDACFVEKGMLFEMRGTFKAMSVHKRAQLS